MNFIGKTFVLINFALSFVFLGWALLIFTNQVDWGWKDPRKDLDLRVPSEIDKRTAALKEALRTRDRLLADLKTHRDLYDLYNPRLYLNHLWYNGELKRLQSEPGEIEVLEVKMEKNALATLDPKELGRPVLENKVTYTDPMKKAVEVTKSYDTYYAEWQALQVEVDKVTVNINKLVEDQRKLTVLLNGKKDDTDKDKVLEPGLYNLLEAEGATQQRLKAETTYLRPLWVRELVDAQLLVERRRLLQARLAELRVLLAARAE